MKITFIPADHDASGHYRLIFPAKYMNEAGHTMEDAPHTIRDTQGPEHRLVKEEYVYNYTQVPRDTEILAIHQSTSPQFAQRPVSGNMKIVYNVDDALMNLPWWNPASRGVKEPMMMGKVMKCCDKVIASTPFLAEQALKYNKNVDLIRNYLYWPMWENVEQQCEVDRGGRVRIGYMGMFAWREGDLREIQSLLGPFLRRNPHVDFVAAGAPVPTHDYFEIPDARRVSVEGFPFMAGHMRLGELMPFDIGLIPLAKHNFNEAKSHLKGMEYNACGIPYVSSRTEAYDYYTREGANGFVVKNAKQWLNRLELLVNDDELRRAMGREARRIAEENKLEDHWRKYEIAYRSVLS